MKFIRYFLLILIVAAQVAYLVYSYGERTKEIENAPHLVLKCKQYDPRDILRGDYFAISNSFLRLELDSPVWGKSLYWGKDFDQERVLSRHIYLKEGKTVLDITPREKGADDAVDLLNTFIDGGTLAVFWKQGEDGIHNATRVEAPGTAEDTAAEGEIRTVMNVEFDQFVPQRVETDEEGKDAESEAEDGEAEEGKENKVILHYTVTATFKFSGITHYDGLHFYIPDNMTPSDYEIPEDWKDKFSVVLVYREDGTVIPNMLCVDGQPYLDAVKALPRREGRSRYNTSLYHDSNGDEMVPVAVPDKEETAGEGKAEQPEEQTEQPSEEVKPEEPQPEVQPQPAEQPQPEVQPQPAEQPQPEVQAQPAEQPQPEVQPQPAEQPQQQEQPQAGEEPAPAPEAPAPVEDDEI